MTDYLDVAVAVLIDNTSDGRRRACVSRRPEHVHQGGLWEFPGGKIEPGEDHVQALHREIQEELGLKVIDQRPLITIRHYYPGKPVCLHVYQVTRFSGNASGLEGQAVDWVPVEQLSTLRFPEANTPIIKALQLPDRYLITGKFTNTDDFIRRLQMAIDSGIRLVQVRIKNGDVDQLSELERLLGAASRICHRNQARLMLNIAAGYTEQLHFDAVDYDGIHADSQLLAALDRRPTAGLFSASCHDAAQLQKAVQLGADFAVLSPVKFTQSHPDSKPIGWSAFADLIEDVAIPVYALGGVAEQDIEEAWQHGGQGIAAISAFWPD